MKTGTIPLLLVLSCVIASGCASTLASMSTVKEEKDDFNGTTTQRLNYNPLSGGGLLDDAQIRFNLSKVTSEKGETGYFIVLVCYGNSSGWVFIEGGESLHMIVDGERVAFSGEGSLGAREVVGDNTQEIAVYPVDLEVLQKIANAKEVRVKVEGSKQSVERHFSEQNLKNVREFVNACVSAASSIPAAVQH